MSHQKILVIEDDENLRGLIVRRLELKGYTVVTASDGDEGLAAVQTSQPNLVICDVMMPLKDGFQVCREMRRSGINVPFMFLTSKGMSEDQLQGFENGADDYVTKPFDPIILEAKVSALLRRRDGNGA